MTAPLGSESSARAVLGTALLAAALTAGLFAAIGDVTLNYYDEGYLWYGVLHTAAGETPLRDFEAYDPGRYYWGAAGSWLLGDGLMAVRTSTAVFQALGLFCGLLAARRVTTRPGWLVLIGLVLIGWMFPRHKLFESSLAMMAVLSGVRLLEQPSARRYLASGVFVGVAACFGRNHGVYAALGHLLLIGWLAVRAPGGHRLRRPLRFVAGIALGYSPVLALIALAPGFGPRFVDSIRIILEAGTNLPLPIPWPWRLNDVGWGSASTIALSFSYVALALGFPLGFALLWRRRREGPAAQALLAASLCIGVFYSHHAWDRAEASHLAQSIHPLLLAAIAAFASVRVRFPRSWRVAGAIGLCVVAWAGFALHWASFGFDPLDRARLESIDLRGDTLWVDADTAATVRGVQGLVERWVPAEAPLFVAPYRVTYYPMLDKASPVWGLYLTRGDEGETDEEMIAALEAGGVDWVLIHYEVVYGGTPFPETRPRLWAYLMSRFSRVELLELPTRHVLFRRRGARPARPAAGSAEGTQGGF